MGWIAVAALAAVHALAGWWGRDFGLHWDEWRTQVMLTTADGVALLPHWYQYPSLTFDLGLLALAPAWLASADSQALHEFAQSHDHLLRMRSLFIALVALTSIWTFGLARSLGRTTFEALVAGALVAGSWELSYHGRWVAPDGLMMMFATLSMWFCVLALARPRNRWWLAGAAIASGLALGAKYPGGLMLMPLLTVALATRPADSAGWWQPVWVSALFALVFFAVTPGALFEPGRVVGDILGEVRHYGDDGHLGHDQEPGLAHLSAMISYLAMSLFSREPLVGGLVFMSALIGWARVARSQPRPVLIVLAVPVLYLAYFASQRVMIVRNLLLMAPFIAVGAGAAAGGFLELLARHSIARRAWMAACAGLIGFQIFALVSAAATIGQTDKTEFVRQLRRHIGAHPNERFAVPPPLYRALSSGGGLPPNVVHLGGGDEIDASLVAIWSSALLAEEDDWPPWPANRRGRYAVFGPQDVNFDYYPNWLKPDRIVVMDAEVFGDLRSWLQSRRRTPREPAERP